MVPLVMYLTALFLPPQNVELSQMNYAALYDQSLLTCPDIKAVNHVARPYRLIVHAHCISVSGQVKKVSAKHDGSYSITLKLDDPYTRITNFGNILLKRNQIDARIICSAKSKSSVCADYENTTIIPEVGDNVLVSGQYVTNVFHVWREIHPAYTITKLDKDTE